MSEKITTGYSELRILLKEIGVQFTDSGDAENNLDSRVEIQVLSTWHEDGFHTFPFMIDKDGNETYIKE
jgi:hypothetical protein